MLPLDHDAAIEMVLRSRWRVTAFDATPGPGHHDAIFDEPHEGPVGALMAAQDSFAAVHPDVDVNSIEWRIVPVHR